MTKFKKYLKLNEKIYNYRYALFVMSYDSETVCPKLDKPNSYNVQNYFYEQIIKIRKSDSYYKLLKDILDEEYNDLDETYKLAIKKEYDDLTKERKIPIKFKISGNKLINQAQLDWEAARENLKYNKFEKDLDKLVKYYQQYIKYLED